uniref:Uncharacterized protein n=1 Tax=Sphaerodactylus townsendi TaxID=933632 RepID=A0ACB8F6S4_9SAUR
MEGELPEPDQHLSKVQRLSFQESALQDTLLLRRRWVREAGFILIYASMFKAQPCLEEDYLKGDVADLLYDLQMGRQLPPAIKFRQQALHTVSRMLRYLSPSQQDIVASSFFAPTAASGSHGSLSDDA